MIRAILDWILDKRLSLAEAFKIMDVNFDGVLKIDDLNKFLESTLAVDIHKHRMNIDRLFKIMDLSKSGSIFMVDFEKLFSKVFRLESAAT